MRLCLMTVPGRTDNPRLGLVAPDDLVLDADEAHATALAGHMEAKRAYQIADALVPSDLYGFIRGGRHGWRALELTLDFLASGAVEPTRQSPRGERVVLNRWEVDLREMLGRRPEADRPGTAGRVYCELADAVSFVSRHHVLALGDVVRAGARALAPVVDVRDNVADGVLEHLLTHTDT